MAKYIFLQPYSIRKGNYSIGSGGATGGTIVKSFNKGDIIEGTKQSMSAGQPNLAPIVSIATVINGETYEIQDYLLKEYTEESLPTNTNKLTSNDSKKTITIVLVVVAILGLLKWKKVI
jgi:hypothetical protein